MNNYPTLRERVYKKLLDANLFRVRAGDVAAALHMKEGTMRKHLYAEGTTYRSILDSVRQERYHKLINTRGGPISGSRVAQVLGYTKVDSFYLAYQRWTGVRYGEPCPYTPAQIQGAADALQIERPPA